MECDGDGCKQNVVQAADFAQTFRNWQTLQTAAAPADAASLRRPGA